MRLITLFLTICHGAAYASRINSYHVTFDLPVAGELDSSALFLTVQNIGPNRQTISFEGGVYCIEYDPLFVTNLKPSQRDGRPDHLASGLPFGDLLKRYDIGSTLTASQLKYSTPDNLKFVLDPGAEVMVWDRISHCGAGSHRGDIKIEEDRGVVLASAQLDTIIDWGFVSFPQTATDVAAARTKTNILINGGRPF